MDKAAKILHASPRERLRNILHDDTRENFWDVPDIDALFSYGGERLAANAIKEIFRVFTREQVLSALESKTPLPLLPLASIAPLAPIAPLVPLHGGSQSGAGAEAITITRGISVPRSETVPGTSLLTSLVGTIITEVIAIQDFFKQFLPEADSVAVIKAGQVKIFHYFVGAHYILQPGDLFLYQEVGPFMEPMIDLLAIERGIPVLYEDDELCVFAKPAHLPCHPSGAYLHHSMTALLAVHGRANIHLLHRLDAETSGVLLGVKDATLVKPFAAALTSANKQYRVLVMGQTADQFVVDFPLGMDPPYRQRPGCVRKRQRRQSFPNESVEKVYQAKSARTEFVKTGSFLLDGNPVSLLMASPITGRTHQIRAHLAESGYPVVGDKLYGEDECRFLQFLHGGLTATLLSQLQLTRHFLHAEMISFVHPFSCQEMTFTCPLSTQIELMDFIRELDTAV